MCEEKGVSLLCLKYCVVCSKPVSHADDAVTCLNTSCNFRVTVDDCESELHNFAEKGSMSFCYACGHEMEREDNIVVCGTCADSIKFEVRTKVFISASDVVRCVLCAETVSAKSSGKLYCSGPKCKFRIMSTDSEMVTDSLLKYATEGKVRFCYACGSSVIKEAGKYIHHSSESCGLTKHLTVLCDEQLVQSGRPSAAAKTASAGWFSWMRSWWYTISPEIWQPEKQEATTGTSCTSSQEMKTTQNSMSITTSSSHQISRHRKRK